MAEKFIQSFSRSVVFVVDSTVIESGVYHLITRWWQNIKIWTKILEMHPFEMV